MARARNIKPSLFKNEVLGVADPLYTLLFEGLWVLADREGRLEDRPMRIRAEVFPYRPVDIEPMLNWLQENEFILRYTVAGKGYILIREFVKHQNPHKNESESVIPPPEDFGTTSEKIGSEPENIGSTRADSLSLIPDSLSPSSVGERFEEFWAAYPKQVGKDDARKAFEARTPDAALLARMLSALQWQRLREQWTREGGRYIPNPAKWLDSAGWEDAPPAEPPEASPPGRDPALIKLDEDAKKAAPIPPAVKAQLAALKGRVLQ